jgi:hypothetical protein
VNAFEVLFRDFVGNFGGDLLKEGKRETADFLFREENIITELKTLENDARLEHAQKLQQLVNEWTRRRLIMAYGRTVISLRALPPICQREWLDILLPPVEGIIRKANRQIRSTKGSEALPTAKGILLVANDGNFLHTDPLDYLNLMAIVFKKRGPNGEPRFPHIDGVVYFSYRVPIRGEPFPFWVPAHLKPDERVLSFQEKLRIGWFSYVAKTNGVPVNEILRKVGEAEEPQST